MWLRIASLEDREEAIKIASRLREIGARVEIRDWIDWEVDEIHAVRGRMSELKSRGLNLEEWEKRIEVIREILKKGIKREDFEEEFVKRMYPELENIEDLQEFADKLMNLRTAMREIETFLAINNIKIGESSDVPEDPELVLEVEEGKGRGMIKVSFYPVTDVYVDVLSVLGADFEKTAAEFEDIVLASVLEIIGEIVSEVEEHGKMDLESLSKLSSGMIEGSEWDFVIDCSEIFENIIRSLEKAGIFRVSGNFVRLRE